MRQSSERNTHWTPDAALSAIRAFYATTGWWPETRDFEAPDAALPSRTTVNRLFGTLAAARLAAGAPEGGHVGHGGARHGGDTRRRRGPRLRLVRGPA